MQDLVDFGLRLAVGLRQDDGHDNGGCTVSSVAEEKAFNAHLGGSANEWN
ncbi:MAG: hypothetical protein NTW51_14610 [Cyanobacteria bacterium]|nr:hypothetical protein [Cyanobacteriota bacterium]